MCVCVGTWRLSGAGLQGAGLLGHRLGEGVASPDQLSALVTFHVPHPHPDAARLGALSMGRSRDTVVTLPGLTFRLNKTNEDLWKLSRRGE